ncbi:hypothetical protein GW17_00027206 [Ensete ventricosum]|nr:hypothetical protein GW17_00027206 [Ensete ventricosum]
MNFGPENGLQSARRGRRWAGPSCVGRIRPIRPRRAEIIVTFSNDLGIAIATPIRKALFGPHARVTVKQSR